MIKRILIVLLAIPAIIFVPFWIGRLLPTKEQMDLGVWTIGCGTITLVVVLDVFVKIIVIPAIKDLINWIKYG